MVKQKGNQTHKRVAGPRFFRDALGLDDNKLKLYHAGGFRQLSLFGGKVIEDLIA